MENIEDIASYIVSDGKGILAADESNPTCTKRFESIGVDSEDELGEAHDDDNIEDETVDSEQAEWIKNCHVFYWGISGNDVSYPECLYQSNYLGLTIFMDEPAVCTRDRVIRPRLESDPDFRKSITPQIVFEEFQS